MRTSLTVFLFAIAVVVMGHRRDGLKNARIPINYLNIFLKYLFQFMLFFPKVKARIKTKSSQPLHSEMNI